MIKNNSRRAMVTIEFAFGLIASAVVLMLVIGLFHNNVAEMVANSRFQNLFNKEGLANQTHYDDLANDPTDIIVTSGSVTGTTAVGGLEYWKDRINNEIAALYEASLQGPLSAAQLKQLAWLATLARVTLSPNGVESEISGYPGLSILAFADDRGITGLDSGDYRTIYPGGSVSWGSEYAGNTAQAGDGEADVIPNINVINSRFEMY